MREHGPSEPPLSGLGACITRSASQSVANSVDEYVAFNMAHYDLGGFWNEDDPSKLFVPISGLYLVGANLAFAHDAVGFRQFKIVKNQTADLAWDTRRAVDGTATAACLERMQYLEEGDFIQCQVRQNSGGLLNIVVSSESVPQMSMMRITL